ncbi:MAG TPA: beta-glucosidase [Opitutae bacterium]|nr:beta-glucosidase [Puniceicoccaceae bacterium]HBR93685.1 beta-glucosidase [Opitutae bacterium]|tara:strand:+ start:32127 stop:33566 length:1440 start_codon:yes stop_codon:yes gene_type:complete
MNDSNKTSSAYPKDFVWGAAAASYQVEGAWDADGKGPSVWDKFTEQKGKIWEGHHGRVACDHYNRYAEDVALMQQIGLKAYRLSVSWPRVLPTGTGKVNVKGLDFYDRLVDELMAASIAPWVTLFHWDFPYALELKGGWLAEDSPKWFADYTKVVVDKLSDRVSNWITLNEPQIFIGVGHGRGDHAPGMNLETRKVLQAGHNTLLAHGLAAQTIRANAVLQPKVGWAPVGASHYPHTDSQADRDATMSAMEAVKSWDYWNNAWWGDPVVFGEYPQTGLEAYGDSAPKVKSGDFAIIKQPLDFYGCNIYSGPAIQAAPDGKPVRVPTATGAAHSHFLWEVTPEALYWGSKFLAERYKLPIVVTENGLSGNDWVSLDGRVHDSHRIDFLNRYLLCLERAIKEGIDIRGYFQWSILDNFEWGEGYKHRFGLVHVGYITQKRTLKDSAYWYRKVIESNGASLHDFASAHIHDYSAPATTITSK